MFLNEAPQLPFGLSLLRLTGKRTRQQDSDAMDIDYENEKRAKKTRKQPIAKAKVELLWAKVFGVDKNDKKVQKLQRAQEEAAAESGVGSTFEPARSSWEVDPRAGDGFNRDQDHDHEGPVRPALEEEVLLRPQAEAEFRAAEQQLLSPMEPVEEEVAEAPPAAAQVAVSAPKARQPPRRQIGLCGLDRAPQRGQGSKCYLCQASIPKQSIRFDYQFSESGKMSRYIHPGCCALIPARAIQNSLKFLREHRDSDIAQDEVRGAITVLQSMVVVQP